MFRGIPEESEQLLGLVRWAACFHEEQLYLLLQARYAEVERRKSRVTRRS